MQLLPASLFVVFVYRPQLLSMILFAVGVVLASVSMGIGQWSQLHTDRLDTSFVDGVESSIMNGATLKTISLLSRCVSYDHTQSIVELGLTTDDQPQVNMWSVVVSLLV